MLNFSKDVHEFLTWWFKEPRWYFPIEGGVKTMPMLGQDAPRTAMDAVIYRRGKFQVQLFAFPAFTIIPEHLHPNVRSYEVYFGGQVSFSLDKKWIMHFEGNNDIPTNNKDLVTCYISENSWHGGIMGPNGGMFLSVQEWLNGVTPSCVGDDWDGKACVEEHLNDSPTLKTTYDENIHWKAAASEEDTPPPWWPK